jgi:hypothetical protein
VGATGAAAPAAATAVGFGVFCHHQATTPAAARPITATAVCNFLKGGFLAPRGALCSPGL